MLNRSHIHGRLAVVRCRSHQANTAFSIIPLAVCGCPSSRRREFASRLSHKLPPASPATTFDPSRPYRSPGRGSRGPSRDTLLPHIQSVVAGPYRPPSCPASLLLSTAFPPPPGLTPLWHYLVCFPECEFVTHKSRENGKTDGNGMLHNIAKAGDLGMQISV